MEFEQKEKLNIILAITVFSVVFVGLMLVATFYDLKISQYLTKSFLMQGEYYTKNQFCMFFECFGATPIFALPAICSMIMFKRFSNIGKRPLRIMLQIICFVVSVIAFRFCFSEIMKYIAEYLGESAQRFFKQNAFLLLIELIVSSFSSTLLYFAFKNISETTQEKLVKFVIVVFVMVVCYIFVYLIKSPVGRVRFRTMNLIGDFSYYTPWYKLNGSRNIDLTSYGYPLIDDNCKSFPSGHTYSGSVILCLICLPNLFEMFNKKCWKISLYVVCILYSVLVALSRIMLGAHFLSDVVFSGGICVLSFIIAREVIIFKCKNFKLLFSKRKKVTQEENYIN